MKKKSLPVIGRREEKRLLHRLYDSKNAEFLAIYGRRRVGKTYLIRNYFKDQGLFFEITGAHNARTKEQLENFHTEHSALFGNQEGEPSPKSWSEAFNRLRKSIESINSTSKIIVFLDELPWLASPRSGFLAALDYAWNRHFSGMQNVLLIVSGSAASWMINHVVNNTGGLYGRLSAHLRLIPFTLSETEEYLQSRNISLPRKQICEIYMVTGGVPKYLSYIEKGLSATQNIEHLCFKPQSPLLTEFYKLYKSLFHSAETHLQIMKALAKKRRGLPRSELQRSAKLRSKSQTDLVLRELEEAGFIDTLPETNKKSQETSYRISDEYTLFYLKWIEPEKGTILRGVEKDYWVKRSAQPGWSSWAGFAFESLCLKHIGELKMALQIGGVSTKSSYWKAVEDGKIVSEIDLVIDRADQCINLCEIKFCNQEYAITKQYAQDLIRKKDRFQVGTKSKKGLFTTLITPYGVKKNMHYHSCIDHQLTLEAFFHDLNR